MGEQSSTPETSGAAGANAPRRILITGANRSLGPEAARRLIEAGHEVWIGARDRERGETAAADLGGRFVQLDVTDDASVAAARDVIAAAGGLDVLVSNAGVLGSTGPVAETTADDVREVYETNVFGVVRVSHAFLPLLAESDAPVVVNVSSGMGSLGRTTDPERIESTIVGLPYPSSKSALNMLTSQYAKAYPGMRINAVDPGYTATDFNAHSGAADGRGGRRDHRPRPSSALTARPAPTSIARAPSPGEPYSMRKPSLTVTW
jgi:NAD(P)-dependent dehydrogenase (short-subunit alcohol dehydrogenase family)